MLAASAERPGFAAWIVRDGKELAGVCYGWPTPPDLSGNRTYGMLIQAAASERTALMTHNAFEVAELFVPPITEAAALEGPC